MENISIARNFRIKERTNLQIRAEFTNVFNRAQFNNPTAVNGTATQTTTATGQTTGGFGYINNGTDVLAATVGATRRPVPVLSSQGRSGSRNS